MDWAKSNRLYRLRTSSGYYCLLALDHPLTCGTLAGLENMTKWVEFAGQTNLSGVIVNKGELINLSCHTGKGIILQLMGLPEMTEEAGLSKVPLGTIDDAVRLAADAVSLQISFESTDLNNAIKDVSALISDAHHANFPVLLMVNNGLKPVHDTASKIKISTQLGADLIKVSLPQQIADLGERRRLTSTIRYGPPVLLAGGSASLPNFEEKLTLAADLGFSGVCVGRNIFQAADPLRMVDLIENRFSSRSSL